MANSKTSLSITLAQLNPTVGDIAVNLEKAVQACNQARKAGADIIVFTELYLCGYPPEDLVLKPAFQNKCMEAVRALAKKCAIEGLTVIIGTIWADDEGLFNVAAILNNGIVETIRKKVDLPNYGPFDEKRVFAAGALPGPVDIHGVKIGVPICEDIWTDEIIECLEETGSEMLISLNSSPFYSEKQDVRLNVAVARVSESSLPLIYLNQVGGQDELVFDGASFIMNKDHKIAVQCPQFEEAIVHTQWEKQECGWSCTTKQIAPLHCPDTENYHACVLGLRDYCRKNGFKEVVLGLSGGIDSALCAAMAVDALGSEAVHCVMLPFKYTSEESLVDAKLCADHLNVRYDILPIEAPVNGFSSILAPLFEGTETGITEENLQSRVRGTLIMALTNKFGSMMLTTGNKSEMSVGYATLYGDMNGGFNPLKDLYKLQVYRLSAWRNANHIEDFKGPKGQVIPENIITKAPSAELREDQTDQDSLPPYEILDDILEQLIENEASIEAIVASGHDRKTAERIEHLLYIAEYKRRQSAPGVRVTKKYFGRDRRYPITNRWRDRN